MLGWSAVETAHLLEASVASVNSSLQRALLERYLRAWEATDLDGFVALLKEDAVPSMPPWRQWYLGGDAIKAFYGAA